MNEKFQNVLQGKAQKTPPIWFMRQAGRYHKHYQNLRVQHSFMELCKDPELACEVTLGPIQDFDFDVAILFSDLLFPLEALGMGLEYTDHGPRLGFQLTTENIKSLKTPEQALPGLFFQKDAMALTRRKLPSNKSLIGFVGGFWTLYVYAVEGSHAGSLIQSKIQEQLYCDFTRLMVPLLEKNIQLQLDGGAEVIMLFDTACGEVSPSFFKEFLQKDLIYLAKKFPGKLGYYSKGSQSAFFTDPEFVGAPWIGRGFDHRWDLCNEIQTQHQSGLKTFVQGNFDQSMLFLPPAEFKQCLLSYLRPFQKLSLQERTAWVCGLGHGVLPKTPEANVKKFIETVREVFS